MNGIMVFRPRVQTWPFILVPTYQLGSMQKIIHVPMLSLMTIMQRRYYNIWFRDWQIYWPLSGGKQHDMPLLLFRKGERVSGYVHQNGWLDAYLLTGLRQG